MDDMQTKFSVKNPSGQKIVGFINRPKGSVLLETIVFCHGFKGYKEQKYIEFLANKLSKKFCFVSFDFTNGIGESEGDILNISAGHYLKDLKTVFSYVRNLDFVNKEKINIGGASFGGMVSVLFASEKPAIKSLILQASVFRPGELHSDIDSKEWKKKGFWWFHSNGKNIDIKVGYQFYEDRLTYDMSNAVGKIEVPTLVIHGSIDDSVPFEQSQDLLNCLKVKKELFIIENAPHTVKEKQHLKAYAGKIESWLE